MKNDRYKCVRGLLATFAGGLIGGSLAEYWYGMTGVIAGTAIGALSGVFLFGPVAVLKTTARWLALSITVLPSQAASVKRTAQLFMGAVKESWRDKLYPGIMQTPMRIVACSSMIVLTHIWANVVDAKVVARGPFSWPAGIFLLIFLMVGSVRISLGGFFVDVLQEKFAKCETFGQRFPLYVAAAVVLPLLLVTVWYVVAFTLMFAVIGIFLGAIVWHCRDEFQLTVLIGSAVGSLITGVYLHNPLPGAFIGASLFVIVWLVSHKGAQVEAFCRSLGNGGWQLAIEV